MGALTVVSRDLDGLGSDPVDLNFVTWSDDASDVIIVGDSGTILMRQSDGTFAQQASQTTENLYGADFPHAVLNTTSVTKIDQTIVVGAKGTALVYGLPQA